jgi:4-aminobutyrate aminotransferase-like enzyme
MSTTVRGEEARREAAERLERERPRLEFGGAWSYAPAPEATDHVRIEDRYGLFIGGRFVPPRSKKHFATINPATEQKLAEVALAGAADVDAAVRAAEEAHRRRWSRLAPAERGKYVYRVARLIQEKARALAVLETIEAEDLLSHVSRLGEQWAKALGAVEHPLLDSVRGRGLWLGLVLAEEVAADVERVARAGGFLVNGVAPNVIRLAPPLVLSEAEAGTFVDALLSILAAAAPAVRVEP